MEIKQLNSSNTTEFCNLIKNMYSNLENLEWFSPMPYDEDNVLNMINSPRFYIVGGFIEDKLVCVSCLDYKCGKLVGKVDFPENVNTEKLVEVGFTIVHSDYRGNGYAKELINHLMSYAKLNNFSHLFAKIHKDNIASYKSFEKLGFIKSIFYKKPVKTKEFLELSSKDFFSKTGKINAEKTLAQINKDNEIFPVEYYIYILNL